MHVKHLLWRAPMTKSARRAKNTTQGNQCEGSINQRVSRPCYEGLSDEERGMFGKTNSTQANQCNVFTEEAAPSTPRRGLCAKLAWSPSTIRVELDAPRRASVRVRPPRGWTIAGIERDPQGAFEVKPGTASDFAIDLVRLPD